jgi:hypothetical protein
MQLCLIPIQQHDRTITYRTFPSVVGNLPIVLGVMWRLKSHEVQTWSNLVITVPDPRAFSLADSFPGGHYVSTITSALLLHHSARRQVINEAWNMELPETLYWRTYVKIYKQIESCSTEKAQIKVALRWEKKTVISRTRSCHDNVTFEAGVMLVSEHSRRFSIVV